MIKPICVCYLVLIEVRLVPSHREQEIEALTFLMITFQRDVSHVLENDNPQI